MRIDIQLDSTDAILIHVVVQYLPLTRSGMVSEDGNSWLTGWEQTAKVSSKDNDLVQSTMNAMAKRGERWANKQCKLAANKRVLFRVLVKYVTMVHMIVPRLEEP